MNKFDYKKVIPRYKFIAIIMVIFAIAIIGRAAFIMTVKHDYWMAVADRVKRDSVNVKPSRGNILSCDGEIMASSLPEFKLYMDFQALHDAKNDSLWNEKLDSLTKGLHHIFPQISSATFKWRLEKGRKEKKRHWPVWDERVDYATFRNVKELPIFRLSPNASGFHYEEYNARQRPYGSLACRTVGEMFGAKDTARCGLELSYDSILRGTNGIVHRRKVLNKFLDIMDTPPIDGADIVTTIDVNIQDLCERSVVNELNEINGDIGVALVMEVATGDIKAIVNMEKCIDGRYREIKNHAVSDLMEPGSVFKTVSFMVALDDGVVDTTYMVQTGCGICDMYGREMKDHNWRKGGFQLLSFPEILLYSSNIGVSKIIDKYYHKDPIKFVKGVYRTGIADNLHIPLVGSAPPRIRMPKKNGHGQWVNWSNTALPWMSIGYESQVPPISTLTFYNAIANNGKMVRPRFVKQVIKDGEVIMDMPVVVMHNQICKEETLKKLQIILEHVVSQGLGKKAGSTSFKVAGKTGTAQISQGAGGYKNSMTHYLLSFVGYFPADNPKYSCIVCLQKGGLPVSGGGMAGPVFHNIAEGIMAQSLKLDVKDARDSSSVFTPEVKDGNILAADYVLSHLGIQTSNGWGGSHANGNPIWGCVKRNGSNNMKILRRKIYGHTYVPDVYDMGARDAVYSMESRGIKTYIIGRGKVIKQSLTPGSRIQKKAKCYITLE